MGSNPFKAVKKTVKKIAKKVIPKEVVAAVAPPPVIAPAPEPTPPPTPKLADPNESIPIMLTGETGGSSGGILSTKTLTKIKSNVVDPVVSDPVPVTAEPMETQETAQDLQRLKTKKKGRKPLIATTSQGLGGEAPTYSPTLLG